MEADRRSVWRLRGGSAGPSWAILSAALYACGGDSGTGVGDEAGLVGTVTAATSGAPIAGAQVRVLQRLVVTGADGTFEITPLPLGELEVTVGAEGFNRSWARLTIARGENRRDVSLEDQTIFEATLLAGSDSIAVWLPESVDSFRGIFFVIAGAGGESLSLIRGWPEVRGFEEEERALRKRFQDFAEANRLAMVGEHYGTRDAVVMASRLVPAVEALAEEAARPELADLPLLVQGFSLGGCVAHRFARVESDRTVGFITQKGQCHDLDDAGGGKAVPGYLFIGGADTEAREINITTTFENNRPLGALWALAVEPGADHLPVAEREVLFAWLDTVLDLRLPADPPPGPVALNALDETSGWLGNRTTFAIASWDCYPGDRGQAAWLPSMADAVRWQALVSQGAVTDVVDC